jgi:hypothetical protein
MVPKSREPCLMSQKQKHAIQDFYIYEMEQHGIFICVCIFSKNLNCRDIYCYFCQFHMH